MLRSLQREDIIKIIGYLIELINSKTDIDDIDHLSNSRVRTVGEQLFAQFGVGLARMARTIRERMNVRDNEVFTPVDLINSKTLSSVINSFFGTNQLSQFMDQTNPLAEMTHKRRMSALGPVVFHVKEQDLKFVTFTIHIMDAFARLKLLKDQTLVLFHHFAFMQKSIPLVLLKHLTGKLRIRRSISVKKVLYGLALKKKKKK
jgi:hypothetical protein